MQTIARANRVTSWKINGVEKKNGEIVDYYGVFRNMNKALKDYAQGGGEKRPVEDKSGLMKLLENAITQGIVFCRTKGILIEGLLEAVINFNKSCAPVRFQAINLGWNPPATSPEPPTPVTSAMQGGSFASPTCC